MLLTLQIHLQSQSNPRELSHKLSPGVAAMFRSRPRTERNKELLTRLARLFDTLLQCPSG